VVAFHAVRAPWYALQTCWWASVGVVRLVGRQLRWWWVTEQYGLRQRAANSDDPMTWLRLHQEAKRTRLWRGLIVAGETAAVGLGGPGAWSLMPWWRPPDTVHL